MMKSRIVTSICVLLGLSQMFSCSEHNNNLEQIDYSTFVCEQPVETTSQEQKQVCPENMVEIEGDFCESVAHICKVWISQEKDRCAEYYRTAKCFGKVTHMRFCLDKYEAGNKPGDYVPRDISFLQAQKLCEARGARLPTVDEWSLACEGVDRTPYEYGFVRSKVCNIDKPYIEPDNNAWFKDRAKEIARLDQSDKSGERPGCRSTYGVYDLTGNLDEIVYDPRGFDDGGNGKEAHYKSALKGGYWAPVRNRCRPITGTHNVYHHWYNTSYRCAKDII